MNSLSDHCYIPWKAWLWFAAGKQSYRAKSWVSWTRLLSQSLPGSGTTTNETPFSVEMKPEPPLGIPVVFQTDLLPLPFPPCRRSPSSGLCIALLSVSGGRLMKCFGAQDQVS